MQGLAWCVTACLLVAATRAAGGQKESLSVLPPKAGQNLLTEYLLAECQKCFDARHKAIAKIDTPAEVLARQKQMREAWRVAVGPFPKKTPLNGRVLGTVDRDAYRIEKVVYESRPKYYVTASLYLPKKGKKPFPGVVVPCGHSSNGKACTAYQSISALLATHGIVALCYDPFGQGERSQLFDAKGKAIGLCCTQHTLADIGARLLGQGAANYRIWDGIRSIDYLCSRPEVDAKRIGCTGNSGGGTMTAYLMATDERIVAAAPSCYMTSLERLFRTCGPQDGEQNITGQVALGIEHGDYALIRAPKATLMLTASKDFFAIDGAWETFRDAKRLYGILGYGERMSLFEYPDGHGFSRPRREAALRWMRRWLSGIDDALTEPKLKLCSDAELQVTKTGHVLHEFADAVSLWDLALARAKALAAQRTAFWKDNTKAKCLAEIKRLAGIRPRTGKPSVKSLGTLARDGYTIEKLLIDRKGEVPVPALLCVPAARKGKLPAVLYVDGRGKSRDARKGRAVEKLVKAGHIVLTIDARGFGETNPLKPKRWWHPEYPIAHMALHLGRSLLGQRVEDAREALALLATRPEVDATKLSIVGIERGGPVALHLAAFDKRLTRVTIDGSIESWVDVVATPQCRNQLNQVVPGALTCYDLPDLAKAIAPRPVTITNPVDPTGQPKKH